MQPVDFSPTISWGILVVVGLILAMLLVTATWISCILHRRQAWDHAERMKALEMGIPIASRESAWPRTVACVSIGVLVPLGTFLCAWLASLTSPAWVQAVIWGAAFLVSTTAVGCATSLAPGLSGSGGRVKQARATGKPPAFDPESFDLIHGRR
ncbi:hypothetical protein SAMN05444166_5897 [Singulisphaera sp. GP187]|uniref:hypothetical protein n=1 Tax=Singulisphaera sp. GP187 TaxID=1882752 RepID=UPI00092B0820|nr:hypothetical protein [Singulisphaera sp. GP187]SIO59020.1 hypothetical protein SAMN05444166_5897 [Singulisphaera sp. GP187]